MEFCCPSLQRWLDEEDEDDEEDEEDEELDDLVRSMSALPFDTDWQILNSSAVDREPWASLVARAWYIRRRKKKE